MWKCPACQRVNDSAIHDCQRCGGARPSVYAPDEPSPPITRADVLRGIAHILRDAEPSDPVARIRGLLEANPHLCSSAVAELETEAEPSEPASDRARNGRKPYVWVDPNPSGASRELMTLSAAWEFVSSWPEYGADGESIEFSLTWLTDEEYAALPEI